MGPASHLDQRILPVLKGWAGRLRAEFPHLTVRVSDLGSGGLAIACILPDVAPDLADLVTLRISLGSSGGALAIKSAAVVWSPPSGHVEAELQPPSGDLTPERIEDFAGDLPGLFAALRRAVRRGHPPA
ncbi:MAG: PilZ domain-containing protein [Hyphomicrobiaceae bacterium]|nr:PilZ domain-containing protein [Hyphomicrobiaceae bacterium]